MTNVRDLDNAVKPELKFGSRVCQCAECGLFFTGVAPFDKHLVGTGHEAQPLCLTAAQMIVRMRKNKYDVWQYTGGGRTASTQEVDKTVIASLLS